MTLKLSVDTTENLNLDEPDQESLASSAEVPGSVSGGTALG
jgi:hypothetical protein